MRTVSRSLTVVTAPLASIPSDGVWSSQSLPHDVMPAIIDRMAIALYILAVFIFRLIYVVIVLINLMYGRSGNQKSSSTPKANVL